MSYNQGYYQGGYGRGRGRGGYHQNGGGGGYRGGHEQFGGRKRARDDDYDQGNYRRRFNERGDYGRQQRGGPPIWNQQHQAPIPFKSPAEEFQDQLWDLGSNEDEYPSEGIPALAEAVRRQWARDKSAVLDGFRTALRDLPHKISHYAALTALLSLSLPENRVQQQYAASRNQQDSADDNITPVGNEIASDIGRALQQYLDEQKWRSARLAIAYLTALTDLGSSITPLVTPASIFKTLDVFRAVLEEPGLSAARGDDCVKTIVETLLRIGPAEEADRFKDAVSSYLANRQIERDLFDKSSYQAQWEDPIEVLISTLTSDAGSTKAVRAVADLVDLVAFGDAALDLTAITLPDYHISPELENGSVTLLSRPEPSSGLFGNEGVGHDPVQLALRLFEDETVPTAFDPAGAIIRSLIADMIAIYEINRKDGATALLSIHRFLAPGLFKDKNTESTDEPKEWTLESLIVESILTSILALPAGTFAEAYYYALLGDLCRASPQTVAPPLGKCIRKLYSGLGADAGQALPVLDAEGVRRFAEWFAVHLSNFTFSWGWKDWAADMELGTRHPKRVFVTHTIALEVRLSYHDRVKGTIPPEMLRTGVMPEDVPSPVYAYQAEDHAHHAAADSLEKSMRQKATVEEIEQELDSFQKTLVAESQVGDDEQAMAVSRDMFASTLFFIGSRSFSHFLNVLERYLSVVKNLFDSDERRAELLSMVARFWVEMPQFRAIVIQKLVQYRVVEPGNVITWLLDLPSSSLTRPTSSAAAAVKAVTMEWHDPNSFELLRATLRTTMIRLEGARARVRALRDQRERERALRPRDQEDQNDDVDMNDSSDQKELENGSEQVEDDEQVKAAESLVKTVEADLVQASIDALSAFAQKVEHSGTGSTNEGDADEAWEAWWIEGWFRELCRMLASPKMDNVLGREQVASAIRKMDLDKNGLASAIISSAQHWVRFV